MRIRQKYLLLILITASVLLCIAFYVKLTEETPIPADNIQEPSALQTVVPAKVYERQPPDPKYPPASINQLSFYKVYSIGEVLVEVQKGETNKIENNAVGATYWVNYTSTKDEELSYTDPADPRLQALNVGCIGHLKDGQYTTFKKDPSLFDKGGFNLDLKTLNYETTSGKAVPALRNKSGFTLPEQKGGVRAVVEVEKSCIYLGTADGVNYWKLY